MYYILQIALYMTPGGIRLYLFSDWTEQTGLDLITRIWTNRPDHVRTCQQVSKWLKAINCKDFDPLPDACICSVHFVGDTFAVHSVWIVIRPWANFLACCVYKRMLFACSVYKVM